METKKIYFINPWVDFILIGGTSIVAFLFLKYFPQSISSTNVIIFAGSMTWLINDPHFSMTSYRLYHSKKNIMQFPMTALVIPVIILLAMIASIQFPTAVAPFFVKLFLIWSPYHFSGQSVGITMVYARRAGFKVGIWERRAISGFIFSCFVTVLLVYESGFGVSNDHFGITYPILGVPEWTILVSKSVMAICGVAILFFAIKWSVKNKRVLPPIVLLPAFTHFVWFLGGSQLASFDELVPFFHSIQYITIAWSVQMVEEAQKRRESPEDKLSLSKKYISLSTLRWWALNIAGGWALFKGIPYLLPGYNANPMLVIGIVAAGAQIHHFFVDGVIWKLKNEKNVSPLTSHIPQLWGATHE